MRFRFAKWACDRLIEDADFGNRIILSDEAHFDLGGYVNKQNCRIWGRENPHAYIEKPPHSKRVTVWCGFWSRGIIGKFFVENKQEDRYRSHVEWIFVCWRGGYWQHLVSTGRRYVTHSRSYTRCFAPYSWRSHYLPQSWCRLATSELRFDSDLWGAVKDKCYADKPEIIDALKDNILGAIGEIQLHTIDNVLKNWTDRGQPRQSFEWNYFPLLTGRILLSNKKSNFRKYSVVFS